jgi:hypothetical protein
MVLLIQFVAPFDAADDHVDVEADTGDFHYILVSLLILCYH